MEEIAVETTYPINVTLKGGGNVELRPLEGGDEQALIDFFRELPREHTEFLKHDVKDPDVVRRFIKDRDPDNVWSILALADGKIVGDATLHMHERGWRRHLGEVRVAVAPTHQKQGVATTLIRALVNHASIRQLRKLEAQILDSQLDAHKAFERLGFREGARLKDHAMDLHGGLHDLVILTIAVEDLWRKMEDMISDMDIGWDRY